MSTTAKSSKNGKPRVEVGIEEARQAFGGFVNSAGLGTERVVLTRHGFPVAAIVSIDDLNSLEAREMA